MEGLIWGIRRRSKRMRRGEKKDKWMKRWGVDEYACVWLGDVISNSGPSHLNDTCSKLFHSFTQYKNSISQQRLSPGDKCPASLCVNMLRSAGKERVNSFVSWNVIQVIVSVSELPQVSFKRLLNTHRGNNVVRSNCWAKGNCEIFRCEKTWLPLLTQIYWY